MTPGLQFPDWVDSLRWTLLPALRRQGTVRCDTRSALTVEAWLQAMAQRGALPDTAGDARGALRAMLCKSAREQAAFDLAYDDWLQGGLDQQVHAQQQAVLAAQQAAVADTAAADRCRQQLVRQQRRRRFLAALALLLAAVAIYGLWQWLQRPPVVVTTPLPKPPEHQVRSPDLQVPPTPAELQAALKASHLLDSLPPPQVGSENFWLFGINPLWFAGLAVLIGGAAGAYQSARQRVISRLQTRAPLREQEVFVRGLLPVSGSRRAWIRQAARQLRRPEPGVQRQLDIDASVRASAAQAGLFAAVHRQRRSTPEYLVLVDRLRPGDAQAHWAIEAARDLAAEGVSLALYEFDHDPRLVAPLRTQRVARHDAAQAALPLASLASPLGGRGLIVLGDGAGLIDTRSGHLQPWLQAALAPWPRRVLVTPRPMAAWGAAEQVLAGAGLADHQPSFLLVPQQSDAWVAAAMWLRLGQLGSVAPVPGAPADLPAQLADDSGRWLADSPPDAQDLAQLLQQLRACLGPTAYTWLAACAAYPHISADLTAYLAGQLSDAVVSADASPGQKARTKGPDDARLLEARLVAIAQLPWSRHGLMPDWLRRALLVSLPAATRVRVREVLQQLLRTAGQAGFSIGAIATDAPAAPAAGQASPAASRWWQGLKRRIGWRAVIETEPATSPLRDVIYLRVLRGDFDSDLSLAVGDELAKALGSGLQKRLSRNPLRWAAAAGLSFVFAVRWMAWALMLTWQAPRFRVPYSQAPSSKAAVSTERLYISYRGNDARAEAHAIHELFHREALNMAGLIGAEVGSADDVRQGPWAERLQRCSIMLVIIGPNWISELKRRQYDESSVDFVALELRAALRRTDLLVLPVLVSGARMPGIEDLPDHLRSLCDRQAIKVNMQQSDWELQFLNVFIRRYAAS